MIVKTSKVWGKVQEIGGNKLCHVVRKNQQDQRNKGGRPLFSFCLHKSNINV